MSSREYVIARISVHGEHFEILVKPEEAFNFRSGKTSDMSKVLLTNVIFTDAIKGFKAPHEKLIQCFQTADPIRIAETIVRRGELQITVEQRRQMIDGKRRQIIDFIHRQAVDPSTGLPHPPLRIEQALEQVHLSIDPFKDVELQAKEAIHAIRPILPLKIEQIKLEVRIPVESASRAYGLLKEVGTLTKEEWQADGSLAAVIELPAGARAPFLDRLGKITKGAAQTKILT